jgi:hypothetical protein
MAALILSSPRAFGAVLAATIISLATFNNASSSESLEIIIIFPSQIYFDKIITKV